MAGEGSARLALRLGSITLHAIGQLLPEQLKAFHNSNYIFPVRNMFQLSMSFRSDRLLHHAPLLVTLRAEDACPLRVPHRREKSSARVHGHRSRKDLGRKDCYWFEQSSRLMKGIPGAWRPYLEQIAALRVQSGDVLRLWPSTIVGETLFGLSEPSVSKVRL